jgi:hypothetical protein
MVSKASVAPLVSHLLLELATDGDPGQRLEPVVELPNVLASLCDTVLAGVALLLIARHDR